MKNRLKLLVWLFALSGPLAAQSVSVNGPDGKLQLTVSCPSANGEVSYAVTYNGKQMLESSPLGMETNVGDFYRGLQLKEHKVTAFDTVYEQSRIKASHIHYRANELLCSFVNGEGKNVQITFRVSNNDVAFRYTFDGLKAQHIIINEEKTAFNLPKISTSFLCPQSDPLIGFARTKPSYEEDYKPDAPLTAKSGYGQGYTFPCLFKVGGDGWVLVSETGTHGNYPGCHISDYDAAKGYQIAFPMEKEADGIGSTSGTFILPGSTPWRTITVGSDLKPLVETTIPYDVVEPRFEASQKYGTGKYAWSWLIWQDESCNYNDQKQFIDLAATMGYEYVLVDALWDTQIGRDKIAELSKYAQSKNVSLMLWYNSNGVANDAPQGPRGIMDNIVARKKEMAWMKSIGIKGIKVDFFGGDKQHTMQQYEDILSDANDYGIQVIFHGCTLPRGWERMYPNYVSSEAVLASENVFFSDYHAKQEAFELTMHPFCRNAVAAMDWGGTIMNKYLSKDNKSRHRRYTTDVFEMASAIMNQAAIQCIAIYPNNLSELPLHEIDFLKSVPTTWDETKFIAGYPGKYAVVARRHGDKWYVAGLNGTDQVMKLTLNLPMLAGKSVTYYHETASKDKKALWPVSQMKTVKVDKKGNLKVEMQPKGGLIVEK